MDKGTPKQKVRGLSWFPLLAVIWWSLLVFVLYSLKLDNSVEWYLPILRNLRNHYFQDLKHPFLSQQCFEYANLNATFNCSGANTYKSYSCDLINSCASKLWTKMRDPKKEDPWPQNPNNSKPVESYNVSLRPAIHFAFVGDSHTRYIFQVFNRRVATERVKYRIPSYDRKRWEDAREMHKLRNKNGEVPFQEVIHLDYPLKITFQWDRLLQVLHQLLQQWISGQTPRPTVLIFGTSLHYMMDSVHIFNTCGKEKAAERFTQQLELLSPLLSAFANTTMSIYRLQDHLGRDLGKPTNFKENIDYYNERAKKVLSKTPVLIWDSTIPLSDMYQNECRKSPKETPDTGDWICSDVNHIGYVMIEQYLDMLLNHVCSNVI